MPLTPEEERSRIMVEALPEYTEISYYGEICRDWMCMNHYYFT